MSKPVRLRVVGPEEDVPRLIHAEGRTPSGAEFALCLRPGDGQGLLLVVRTEGRGKAAQIVVEEWNARGGDSPTPASASSRTLADAVAAIKALARGAKAGPSITRGAWSGTLTWDGTRPIVSLTRKVAMYATVHVASGPDGWTARVERDERWFTEAGAAGAGTAPSLAAAIQTGMGVALGLVREACGVRDTHRRRERDPAFAAAHPAPPERPAPEPAKRLGARVPALAKTAVPEEACPSCAAGFHAAVTEVKGAADTIVMELGRKRQLEDTPAYLKRTAALIRRAQTLAESPLCAGPERASAEAALGDAAKAYEEARQALRSATDERTVNGAVYARRIAEQVALAAAKIARACSTGQTALPGAQPRPARAAAERAPKTPPTADAKSRAADAAKVARLTEAVVEAEHALQNARLARTELEAVSARLATAAEPFVNGPLRGTLPEALERRLTLARSAAEKRLDARAPEAPPPTRPRAAPRAAAASPATPRTAPKADKKKDQLLFSALSSSIRDVAAELKGST